MGTYLDKCNCNLYKSDVGNEVNLNQVMFYQGARKSNFKNSPVIKSNSNETHEILNLNEKKFKDNIKKIIQVQAVWRGYITRLITKNNLIFQKVY